MHYRTLTLATLLTFLFFAGHTQKKDQWNVNNPGGNHKTITFDISEGTWMNLDISPDGKQIVFDLLGDIYLMPAEGGTATVLREGLAMETQPAFSPDGKHILFTSDAGGGDNIWMMDSDGKNATQITKEDFRLLNNAQWTPDGNYIIARKHFTSQRSLGAGEMWIYHVSGGKGLALTQRKNDQQDVNEPSISPDGRYVYYSEDTYPGGAFQYNKDPNDQIFAIKRFDRETGKTEDVTGGSGGAIRPQISRDGKTLAFLRRQNTKTVLYLRNVLTGEEWPVYDKLSKDQQEAWTTFGAYTRFAWTPDNQHIIIWANGKINKVDISKANASVEIPFTCHVNQKIAETVRFKQDLGGDKFNVKVIRHAVTSPDGKWLVFNALGSLWKKQLPNGKPERVTNAKDFEFEPSFSHDGKSIVYVTWNDEQSGAIWRVNTVGPSKPLKLTQDKGIYRTPSFSTDGKNIVFEKSNAHEVLGESYTPKPGIYTLEILSGKTHYVGAQGNFPKFNSTGDRIFFQRGGSVNREFGSVKSDGTDERTHVKSVYGSQFIVSPDNQWVAFVDLHKVYVAAFPLTGKTMELNSGSTEFPVRQVSKDAGSNLHWSGDSKSIHYTLGDQYYTIKLEDRFKFIANKNDSLFVYPETGIGIGLEAKTDKPAGIIAYTNARIISMKGDQVIEKGNIITEGNIIKAVGSVDSTKIPAGAKVIDCSGNTIMPGFVDAHAHGNHWYSGLHPQKDWAYYANLAYGVTTMHDPSANSEYVFGASELIKAGLITGPRVFSTGTILYGADGNFKALINSLDDARSALRRTKAYGAFSVKSYNQPRREQRQMIIQAARELNMMVVPEGGSFFYHNLSMIMDGHTTIEHNMPVAPLYQDVITLWKNSGTAYTPTLIVSYGAVNGEFYWYQHSNVWEKERLTSFIPRSIIQSRARHRTMIPEEEYLNGHILVSNSVNTLNKNGVKVNMGAHGQLQGLGAHWEMWMFSQGGMSNHDVLRAGTINSAYSLGLDQWVGSIEVNKLADFIVLEKNPLENIRDTEFIKYTIANGRLYDAATMNEIGHQNKPRGKFYWELTRNATAFPAYQETRTFGSVKCSCGKH